MKRELILAASTFAVIVTLGTVYGIVQEPVASHSADGSGNAAPVAILEIHGQVFTRATPDRSVLAVPEQPLAFNGCPSRDPDGRLTLFVFDFGDGAVNGGAKTCSVTRSWASPGSYDVFFGVKDDSKAWNNVDGFTVTVVVGSGDSAGAAPPAPRIKVTRVDPQVHEDVTFVASGLDQSRIVSYRWDFGDGTTVEGKDLDVVATEYARAGTYLVRLTVQDAYGRLGDDQLTLSVRARSYATAVDEPPKHPGAEASVRLLTGRGAVADGGTSPGNVSSGLVLPAASQARFEIGLVTRDGRPIPEETALFELTEILWTTDGDPERPYPVNLSAADFTWDAGRAVFVGPLLGDAADPVRITSVRVKFHLETDGVLSPPRGADDVLILDAWDIVGEAFFEAPA